MPKDEDGIYIIPPNFIDSGTLLGGMVKIRNAFEAGAVALAVGIPVFQLPLSITAKIIALCLTALPLAIIALIGISGESLSSFALNFLKYWRSRRVIGKEKEKRAARVSVKKKRDCPVRERKEKVKPPKRIGPNKAATAEKGSTTGVPQTESTNQTLKAGTAEKGVNTERGKGGHGAGTVSESGCGIPASRED